MTGTTEETRPIGLTTRVTDALDALRARVRGGSEDVGAPRAGVGGIPPMPAEAPTVGMPPWAGDGAFHLAVDEVPGAPGSRVPQGVFPGGEDFFGPDTASGIPPMPESAPTVGFPLGAEESFSTEEHLSVEEILSVPPMPQVPPTVGVPTAGDDHASYDTPPPPPPVPPMPSTAPIVPPVPPYDPPAPAADDDGTARLFLPPMDARRLHKYPFCAPPLNQNTFGSRHRHRRVSQVSRQGGGVS